MLSFNDSNLTQEVKGGSAFEVFRVFLGLGLTSFGGPVAHLGYFREAFVVQHRWISDRAYADLVALCQFLPGPASSQFGMAVGLMRAGYLGLLAAWVASPCPRRSSSSPSRMVPERWRPLRAQAGFMG